MDLLTIFTLVASGAIIITKWFDCQTTAQRISGIGMEQNPIARVLMRRFGISGTIWGIFVFVILYVTALQSYILLFNPPTYIKAGYLFYGAIVATVQCATALNNHQGRPNAITRVLLIITSRIKP
jgi:hypothetical protein